MAMPEKGSGAFYANLGSALSPSTKKTTIPTSTKTATVKPTATTLKSSQQSAAEKAAAESLAVMKLRADIEKANAKSAKPLTTSPVNLEAGYSVPSLANVSIPTPAPAVTPKTFEQLFAEAQQKATADAAKKANEESTFWIGALTEPTQQELDKRAKEDAIKALTNQYQPSASAGFSIPTMAGVKTTTNPIQPPAPKTQISTYDQLLNETKQQLIDEERKYFNLDTGTTSTSDYYRYGDNKMSPEQLDARARQVVSAKLAERTVPVSEIPWGVPSSAFAANSTVNKEAGWSTSQQAKPTIETFRQATGATPSTSVGTSPTKIRKANGQIVDGYISNGQTFYSDGSRIQAGDQVTIGDKTFQMGTDGKGFEVKPAIQSQQVQQAEEKVVGTANNVATPTDATIKKIEEPAPDTMLVGSRIPDGATITIITKPDGSQVDGYVVNGQTFYKDGTRIGTGDRVTIGGKTFEMGADGKGFEVKPASTPASNVVSTTPPQGSQVTSPNQADQKTDNAPSLEQTYAGLATAQVDKQIAEANAQLDKQIAEAESNRDFALKAQLENYKQAQNAMRDKAFLQEQGIAQSMASRGLLNSGIYADALIRSGISVNQNLRDLAAKQDVASQKLYDSFKKASDKIDTARTKLETNRETNITKLKDSLMKENTSNVKETLKTSLDMLQTLAKDNNLDISKYAPYMFAAAANPNNASQILSDLANALYNDPNPALSATGKKLVEQTNLIKKQQQEVDAKIKKITSDVDKQKSEMTGLVYMNGVPVKDKDGKLIPTFDAQIAAQKALQKAQDSADTKAYRDQLIGLKGASLTQKVQNDANNLALKTETLNQRIKEYSVNAYKEGDKIRANFLSNYVTSTGNVYRNAVSEYNALTRTKPDGTFVAGTDNDRATAMNKVTAAKIANENAIQAANDLLNTGDLTKGFDSAYSSFFGGGSSSSKPTAPTMSSSSTPQGWSMPDYYTK